MKVLLLNGSPHEQGSTYRALQEAASALQNNGIETEVIHISGPLPGCDGCGVCRETNGRCVYDDQVNACLDAFSRADGLIVGAPVHYSGIAGTMKCFLDRFFYAGSKDFRLKPAAAVAVLRRSGGVATFDQLNHYFTICGMYVVSSSYWNVVHGNNAEQVEQDLEGMQIMRELGNNMAYFLKKFAASGEVPPPEKEKKIGMNFIR